MEEAEGMLAGSGYRGGVGVTGVEACGGLIYYGVMVRKECFQVGREWVDLGD